MLLKQNRVASDSLHSDLLSLLPWGRAENGKFTGTLALGPGFGEDEDNVSVYSFDVEGLIDDFINDNECGKGGLFEEDGTNEAKIIIKNLHNMIARLTERLRA